MCGISGILHKNGSPKTSDILLMNNLLSHRGPDGSGVFCDESIGLGHVRLKIIDLLSRSNQPMTLENLIIVFNGEIYNYLELKKTLALKGAIFKTTSDTEVILWAYKLLGEGCLEEFRGMFSFAIWDQKEKRLFCARDRLGIKPFYFSENKDGFFFSSEIKAILPFIGASPNYKAIQRYLIQGIYAHNDETFFDRICTLQPSHYMVYHQGKLTISSYWDIKDRDKFANEQEAKDKYMQVMLDSVNFRLRSDVPIGMNVSGGLDSSLLLGSISRFSNIKTRTYTYTCSDPNYDETLDAQKLAESFGHEWNPIYFDEKEFLPSLWSSQWYQEEPFGGLPILAHSKTFQRAKAQGVSVVLCGAGMDEQWAGYDYYENALGKLGIGDITVIQGTTNPLSKVVLNEDFVGGYCPVLYPNNFRSNIDNLKYRDLFITKIPRSLRFFDRMSMQHGVELRVPFLDHKLVDFSFKMPDNFMIKSGVRKYLLREMAQELIPNKVAWKPKAPIQTPMREWLKEARWVKDIIFSNSFKQRNIFNNKEVAKTYSDYVAGKFDNSFFLWQWINLEVWFQVFID